MASSGIRRKVDDLGRVVIPAAIRRSLNIREGDAVEVTVEGERVVLSRPHDACVFCGREEDEAARFRGRLVCRDCVRSVGDLDAPDATSEGAQPVAASRRTDPSVATWEAAGRDAPTPPPEPTPRPRPRPWPSAPDPDRRGPIDGDAAARAAARQLAVPEPTPVEPPVVEPPDGDASQEAAAAPTAGHPVPAARRRIAQSPDGPASTTAW